MSHCFNTSLFSSYNQVNYWADTLMMMYEVGVFAEAVAVVVAVRW